MRATLRVFLAGLFLFSTACEGPAGPAGAAGQVGDPGTPCTLTDNGDGTYDVNCDGTVITLRDGAGATCSVADNGDGTKTISCSDGTSVVVRDGKDQTAGEVIPWAGGVPISRRVHAIHNGQNLTYPNETVAYNDLVKGRNWDIEFTQDIRNCETCHPTATTSGSFLTEPDRHACRGCHDSDAAQAHYKVMTFDPTPNAPWSGDEEESCKVCHTGSTVGTGVGQNHSTGYLLSTGEYEACPPGTTPSDCGKFFVDITVTSAVADPAGQLVVEFHVADKKGLPVDTFDGTVPGPQSDIQLSVVSLEPPTATRAYSQWVPYIFTTITVPADGPWPNPAGTSADMGSSEDIQANAANFMNLGGGNYRYTFTANLANATANGQPIVYDRSRLHRVEVRTGGHEDATGEGTYDWVPDGSASAYTRDIVPTNVCQSCHGEFEFRGHGGDRLTLEGCNLCHNSFYSSPFNDESLGMVSLVHKIHSGSQLASIPGADGLVWDDPATAADESADNGDYVIYRERNGSVREYRWWEATFPAVIANCTKCHTGSGANVDNWKTVPSRYACGTCHDTTSFVDPPPAGKVLHTGGAATSDAGCVGCHPASGTALAVEESHDWASKTPRHQPEFGVTLSVSTPANGTHFVAGESPVVTLVLDKAGTPIDHTTVVEDDDGAEGCTAAESEGDACPAEDGKFTAAYLFVHGPRGKRNPVLTTAARAEVYSTGTGPFDISSIDAQLKLAVDGGRTIRLEDLAAGAGLAPGEIAVPVASGTFADPAAATVAEIIAWLNADAAFNDRAIAYEEDGRLALRSRNLGTVYSIQLLKSAVTAAVFGGDTSLQTLGGYYPNNVVYQHVDPAEDDPKAAWSAGAITYTLDPVDDLMPGTYVASVEIADRGRVNGSDYATPSVGWVTFQVKQAAEELPPAGNCATCHQDANGRGFVLDFARHNKQFSNDAIDQCGACHDLQNRD
ncbi:MAG: cytochrome C [Deltaproteobacteria bacterium]|nr:cytochrome C [Deltaproteobacteria bacterium]